ncbi:hypothetical protein DTO96_102320 [Ephemeroptericola cinctiostellae]|uniref:Uncharacterized protein n=1 Tax=Ephemeroptericola cinctiostellae TaxID=2268024 RepID=A0A345DDX7_9BURK|nr:hypothetical protein [Ephemeroptericola cinctiostellae]AXF86565.1 hypothetical protein DTO96_102320 [Ephemeroptericola cinctiostellae]
MSTFQVGLIKVWRFLKLLFWEAPFKLEPRKASRDWTWILYCFVVVGTIVPFVIGQPDISEAEYPTLIQTTVVEGTVIRRESDNKVESRQYFGIRTPHGDVFKRCETMTEKYYGPSDCIVPDQLSLLIGEKAKMWYWGNWLIKIQMNNGGEVSTNSTSPNAKKYTSYEDVKIMRTHGAFGFWSVFILPIIIWTLIRILRRYLVSSFKTVF